MMVEQSAVIFHVCRANGKLFLNILKTKGPRIKIPIVMKLLIN